MWLASHTLVLSAQMLLSASPSLSVLALLSFGSPAFPLRLPQVGEDGDTWVNTVHDPSRRETVLLPSYIRTSNPALVRCLLLGKKRLDVKKRYYKQALPPARFSRDTGGKRVPVVLSMWTPSMTGQCGTLKPSLVWKLVPSFLLCTFGKFCNDCPSFLYGLKNTI